MVWDQQVICNRRRNSANHRLNRGTGRIVGAKCRRSRMFGSQSLRKFVLFTKREEPAYRRFLSFIPSWILFGCRLPPYGSTTGAGSVPVRHSPAVRWLICSVFPNVSPNRFVQLASVARLRDFAAKQFARSFMRMGGKRGEHYVRLG